MQQQPTCTGIRVRTPADAHVIFHAVSLNLLPMVSRRLDTEERRAISSGCVYVWEERGPNAEATGFQLGIERWTDSIRWGPSRVRDEFLYYHEREGTLTDREFASDSDTMSPSRSAPINGPHRDNLIKQTYSVFVETPRGRRKWHLIAYFTQETLDFLRTIDDFHQLASLAVPPGKYKTARSAKNIRIYAPHPDVDHGMGFGCGHSQIYPVGIRRPTQSVTGVLAPLAYLQNIPPPRRHPLDEKALMSFAPGLY
ncbi:Gti1/Pac2 family-domain-containing protein [Collybia nuda]|uniref:Gti1/Pac2 family-domain-containing protein n=1 Tax=Collybia nuda TaxID=64659 RepID=A0A9P6CE43_9AGAR|nr:Gti1/Pac2 family-domain-containing protein [Collybia nuda]